jgi:ferritin-like metal-binding protein YciE
MTDLIDDFRGFTRPGDSVYLWHPPVPAVWKSPDKSEMTLDRRGILFGARRSSTIKTNRMKSTTSRTKTNGSSDTMDTKLQKLFEEELKDIYWAEKALVKALPKMIKKATSPELVDALENHLNETEEQVRRVEKVFASLGKDAKAKKCEAMQGLIDEADTLISESDEGVMRDAAIISAAQKVEHYEIASYGTLRTFAQTLGLHEAVSLLEQTLNEEKTADETLTQVAESTINLEAAEEPEE